MAWRLFLSAWTWNIALPNEFGESIQHKRCFGWKSETRKEPYMNAITRTTHACTIETSNEDLKTSLRAHGAKTPAWVPNPMDRSFAGCWKRR